MPSNNHHRSVLGVSKKMVSSTSRKVAKATTRPLRTVGRFVSRGRAVSDSHYDGEPTSLMDSHYGTLRGEDVGDEDADGHDESSSSHSSVISILMDGGAPINTSNNNNSNGVHHAQQQSLMATTLPATTTTSLA